MLLQMLWSKASAVVAPSNSHIHDTAVSMRCSMIVLALTSRLIQLIALTYTANMQCLWLSYTAVCWCWLGNCMTDCKQLCNQQAHSCRCWPSCSDHLTCVCAEKEEEEQGSRVELDSDWLVSDLCSEAGWLSWCFLYCQHSLELPEACWADDVACQVRNGEVQVLCTCERHDCAAAAN